MEKNESDKPEKFRKAYLAQRLFAYFIDTFIVLLIASIVASPFVDSKKIAKLEEEYSVVLKEVVNNADSAQNYQSDIVNIGYDIAVQNGMATIIQIIIGVLYFVVLQVKLNGQTLGKKIAKIRVVSNDGELTYNQMIFRSFISNSILLNIITILFLMFSNRNTYYSAVVLFSFIQYVVTFISVIMILYSKYGCAVHDRLTHTKVVRLK